MSGLPKGWAEARLDEVAHACLGKMLDKATRTRGQPLPYLRNQNVRWGEFDLKNVYEMPFEPHELERYAVAPGDVLICEGGEPGRAAIWNGPSGVMKFQKALHRVRVGALLDPRFLVHRLRFDAKSGGLVQYFTGTTIKHLPGDSLATYRLRLPPIAEQHRIVAKLDELFARSRAARASLERLPALLERLRQSVLAAAFRGDLTKAWREAHPDVEPAEKLLERIRVEHRRKWEGDLRAKGKDPRKVAYKEPEPVDAASLPELPEGWAWARLEEVAANEAHSLVDGPFGSNLKTADYVESGVRVIRLGNIGVGEFIDEDRSFVSVEKAALLTRHHARAGDVVIAALAEPVGRACLVPEIGPALVKADCVRLRVHPILSAPVIMHALNEPLTHARLEAHAHGLGRLRINLGELRSTVVPVPPVEEQHVLAAAIQAALAAVSSIGTSREAELARLAVLEQAVLAAAFRGELVPQDPSDEPASVLLERIRAERAASGGTKARRTPRAAKVVAASFTATKADEVESRLLALLRKHGRLTSEQAREALGLDAATLRGHFKQLVSEGRAKVEGKARGTVYVWGGG